MNSTISSPGQIITFYSYKGGTGRSMALANVACLFAQKRATSGNVLMIDWDLEAPGLHLFFHDKIGHVQSGQNLPKGQLGLIDLFYEIKACCERNAIKGEVSDSFFDDLELGKHIVKLGISSLYLLPAGRFDDGLYSSRVNAYNWEEFFSKYPYLITAFAEYLRKKFQYVLIDSRTGYTDISGICTTLMPEKLVVVFTPNRQSLAGVIDLTQKATEYRKQSDDLRPLVVFPIASRLENAERGLQQDWRFGNSKKGIIGYQSQFESILRGAYDLKTCDLTDYFDIAQIQYVPKFAYGEDIAVLTERASDRLSIARSYEYLAQFLVELEGPWSSLPIERPSKEDLLGSLDGNSSIIESSQPTEQPLRIFLCHSSNDKPEVRALYQRLNAEDWIDPWLDEEKLLPGQDWNLEIEKAVRESDVVIVCFSNMSVSKEGYVQKEIKHVLDNALEKPEGTIYIIPLRLNESQVPSRLKEWQYLDYFPKERREFAYGRLLNSLKIRAKALGRIK
jgi:MinD-like ATPase involved in chromosome partitioning or flagellar assembly